MRVVWFEYVSLTALSPMPSRALDIGSFNSMDTTPTSASANSDVVSATRATRILDWLQSLLKETDVSSSISSVETTSACLNTLERLQTAVDERNTLVRNFTEDCEARAAEYAALTQGFQTNCTQRLDSATLAAIDTLAAVASELALPFHKAAVALSDDGRAYIVSVSREAEKVATACARADELEADAELAYERLLSIVSDLKRANIALEKAKEDARKSNIADQKSKQDAIRLQAKSEEYTANAAHMKREARSSGISAEYTHDAVLESSNAVLALEDEDRRLDDELSRYGGLPPVSLFDFVSLFLLPRRKREVLAIPDKPTRKNSPTQSLQPLLAVINRARRPLTSSALSISARLFSTRMQMT